MFAKVFEQKWVIRFFGLALILAPFFNTASSVLEIPSIDKKFLLSYCWQFFKSAPAPQQILQISSVVIGVLMLRGSVTAWRYTLALLGGYIILQFTQLSGGARDNTTWMFLATNVVCFFFIADQLVLKPRPKVAMPTVKVPEAPATAVAQPQQALETPKVIEAKEQTNSAVTLNPATQPDLVAQAVPQNVTPITSAHQSAKRVYVNFEGFGNWATISDISEAGIKVRAISSAPPEITSRTIELSLSPHVNVRLKFSQQEGSEYAFNFVELSTQDKQSLNQWLLTAAA